VARRVEIKDSAGLDDSWIAVSGTEYSGMKRDSVHSSYSIMDE
jgi:hypothetical protein